MLNRCVALGIIVICLVSVSFGQPPQFKVYNYMDAYSKQAVEQMIIYKIPASVILAQAIYESNSGTSDLAKKSNNHFGIKCHREWGGDTIVKHDDSLNECFRKYETVSESYTDHSLFLVSRPRYSNLFTLPITDYKAWCIGLKNCGYATSPSYAENLIKLIEDAKLFELDCSERLTSKSIVMVKEVDVKPSRYSAKYFALKDFCGGVMWLDEKYILLQSLDMIVDTSDDASDYLAEK